MLSTKVNPFGRVDFKTASMLEWLNLREESNFGMIGFSQMVVLRVLRYFANSKSAGEF